MSFLESLLTFQLGDYLRDLWGDTFWVNILIDVMGVVAIATFCLLIVIFLIWLERKVIARMQDRIGPNRVGGRYGLGQTVADVVKLLSKELITPSGADVWAYNIAPLLVVMTAISMWAIIPFGPRAVGVNLNIGVFYFLAISSVSVVCILLAGWGSNNKYALIGAFRAVAQLVSYEVPMVMSLIVPILLARSMATVDIINAQTIPFIAVVPLSALVFFISALAETGRTPFDLIEAESEIVAGFHVEYGGMKFGMFFLAEFIGTLFMSAFFATVYLGGWNLPILNLILSAFGTSINLMEMSVLGTLIGLIVFFTKTFLVYFVFIWIRATWPRLRIDQMLNLNWKVLVPLSLVMVLTVAVLDKLLVNGGASEFVRAGTHFISNLLIGFIALELVRRHARQKRQEKDARVATVMNAAALPTD